MKQLWGIILLGAYLAPGSFYGMDESVATSSASALGGYASGEFGYDRLHDLIQTKQQAALLLVLNTLGDTQPAILGALLLEAELRDDAVAAEWVSVFQQREQFFEMNYSSRAEAYVYAFLNAALYDDYMRMQLLVAQGLNMETVRTYASNYAETHDFESIELSLTNCESSEIEKTVAPAVPATDKNIKFVQVTLFRRHYLMFPKQRVLIIFRRKETLPAHLDEPVDEPFGEIDAELQDDYSSVRFVLESSAWPVPGASPSPVQQPRAKRRNRHASGRVPKG